MQPIENIDFSFDPRVLKPRILHIGFGAFARAHQMVYLNDAPQTAIGVIVSGLERRKNAGLGGLSVISCDNLSHNGTLARAAVTDFARHRDPALADWIAANVTFPATMIDRIVPALDATGLDLIETVTGRRDENSIVTEPFRQWVIEDNFVAGRPDWQHAGAQIVPDVGP